jgi:outer membrane receptor protein involved in Fe transport
MIKLFSKISGDKAKGCLTGFSPAGGVPFYNNFSSSYKKGLLYVLFIISLFSSVSFSQGNCDEVTLNEARKRYEIGDFEGVVSLLNPCIHSGFSGGELIQAYKLLSITYIAIDSAQGADAAINMLLKLDPSFEPDLFDPPRFVQKIRGIKLAGSKSLVTSVSKRAENINEAPATVISISSDEIRKRGYQDLDAILGDLPGFDITRNLGATYSNIYQRGYRSNGTDRTIFLIDGVDENDLWSNISYVSRQYSFTNIDKVEVVYGPASTMYGANAFEGVVNVITKEPKDILKGKQFGVSALANYGSYNTKLADVTVAGQVKDVSFSISARKFLSDEMDLSVFPDYDYSPALYDGFNYKSKLSITSDAENYIKKNNLAATSPYYTITRDADGKAVSINLTDEGAALARNKDKAALMQTVNGSPVKYKNLSNEWLIYGKVKFYDFTVGYQTWKKKTGGTGYFTDNWSAGADNGVTWVSYQTFFYTKYETALSDQLTLSNYTQYKIHCVDNNSKSVNVTNYSNGGLFLADLANNKDAFWTTSFFYQISKQLRNELKVLYTPSTSVDVICGLEIRNSQLQGNYNTSLTSSFPSDSGYAGGSPTAQGAILGGNQYDIRDWGFYAQGSYKPMENLKFTLGGRYDYNIIRQLGGYGSEFNPRIAVVYLPENFVIKAIYSEAMKDASNWTKFATNPARLLPSPNLKPEKVKNIELSVGYNFTKDLYVDVAAYKANYTGIVGTKIVPYGNSTTGINYPMGSMEIKGIQSNLTYKYKNYDLYANYTYTDPQNTDDDTRIGDIAGHNINFGLNALYFEKLNVNLRVNYMGERKTGPGTTVPANPYQFPSVTVANLTVNYSDIFMPGITLQFLCNNIFDKEYFTPGIRSADGVSYAARVPQKDRNFMFRVLFDLN